MGKLKILFVPVEQGLGASGIYRLTLPAIHLNRRDKINAVVELATRISPDLIDMMDVVILQRAASAGALRIVEYCYNEGKKIVVDTDDLLTSIPHWNPTAVAYPQENLSIYKKILQLADLVTTTTPKLAHKLQKITRQVTILPNCVDFELFEQCKGTRIEKEEKIRIAWCGSGTHQKDFEIIEDVMLKLIEKYNITFVIYGQFPDSFTKGKFKAYMNTNIEFWGGTSFSFFYPTLYRLNADIGIAPLLDISFNEFKSPLKVLEYGMAGLSVVASDVAPFRLVIDDGVNGYLVKNKFSDWYDRLAELVENEQRRKELANKLLDKVKNQYNIKTQVYKWEEAYLSLKGSLVELVGVKNGMLTKV